MFRRDGLDDVVTEEVRGILVTEPFKRYGRPDVVEWPWQLDRDLEFTFDVERLRRFGFQAGGHREAHPHDKSLQRHPSVQLQKRPDLYRGESDHGSAFHPSLESHLEGPKLPTVVVSDPRAEPQIFGSQHPVGLSLEEAEDRRLDPLLLRIVDSEIEMPGEEIVEVEVRLHRSPDLDQRILLVLSPDIH